MKNRLPLDLIEQNMQNQYTLLASASRSANMDRIIRAFSGTQTGRCDCPAGLWSGDNLSTECDNGKTHWYAVDLPHVIEYRRDLLPEPERELYISGDALQRIGSKKFAMMYLMLLFSLLQADYFIILRNIRSLPFCV